MMPRRIIHGITLLVCFLMLVLTLGPVRPAWAAREDAGMFYDALTPFGKWVDYGKYGPVWYPTKTPSSWRPYLDGRWVPSYGGWVFETSEPWGWATYHYGNWMPTSEFGWVWSPGSTWYPSTAAWRTSDDYVGWAPVPPPDYVPEPAFYPGEGYNPEAPVLDQLAAPLWLFVRAAEFLLGLGEPFAPAYSYYNCIGCLAPLSFAPIAFGGTFPLTDFHFFVPGAFFTFGPPFPFVSRISRINISRINGFINTHNFTIMRNVLPPVVVLEQFPFLRGAIPPLALAGQRLPLTRVAEVAVAERALNRPGVVPLPANVPLISSAIPLVSPGPFKAVGRENLGQIKGMPLPRLAERPLTPFMRRQIGLHGQLQGLPRIETRPEFRPLAKSETSPPVEIIRGVTRERGARGFQAAPGEVTPQVFRGRRLREIQPAPSREFRQPALVGVRERPFREFRGPTGLRFSVPREFRAAPPPVFRSEPRSAPALRAISPQPRGLDGSFRR